MLLFFRPEDHEAFSKPSAARVSSRPSGLSLTDWIHKSIRDLGDEQIKVQSTSFSVAAEVLKALVSQGRPAKLKKLKRGYEVSTE